MGIGSAIGAVGSVVGGISASKDAKKEREASNREAAMAEMARQESVGAVKENQANVDALQEFLTGMGEQGIEHAQGMLDDWEDTFGGIQDNLSEYYNNLDPDKFATQSKVEFRQSLDKQMKQYDETMAASGLQSAGMKAQTAKEAMFKTAEANAQIDINAPEQVAQMQAGFLASGEPQRAGAESAFSLAQGRQAEMGTVGFQAQTAQSRDVATAMAGSAGAHEASAAQHGESAAGYSEASGNLFGSAMNLGIKALDSSQEDPIGRF